MTIDARPTSRTATASGGERTSFPDVSSQGGPDSAAWSDLTENDRLARVGALLRTTAVAGEQDADPATVLPVIARSVCGLLGWDGWGVWLSGDTTPGDRRLSPATQESADLTSEAASDLVREAARHAQPVAGTVDSTVLLAVPMTIGDRVEAVVGFAVGHGDPSLDEVLHEVVSHVVARAGLVVERARHLAAVETANTELRRSNAELEQFAYVASHDLQEPLRKVASYCALLQRRYADVLDADGQEFVAYAVDGAVRMKTLINDLLEYSRVGRSGHAAGRVPLRSTVRDALESLATAIEESQAQIIVADDLPVVIGHRNELVALLHNLLSNALKFRAADAPLIHVDGGVRGDRAWLSVRDNGVGIDPRYHERVFGVFQRLHGRDEYAGTGIGLAMCRRIVETHGGTIRIESAVDDGTTMQVELPAPAPEVTA